MDYKILRLKAKKTNLIIGWSRYHVHDGIIVEATKDGHYRKVTKRNQ